MKCFSVCKSPSRVTCPKAWVSKGRNTWILGPTAFRRHRERTKWQTVSLATVPVWPTLAKETIRQPDRAGLGHKHPEVALRVGKVGSKSSRPPRLPLLFEKVMGVGRRANCVYWLHIHTYNCMKMVLPFIIKKSINQTVPCLGSSREPGCPSSLHVTECGEVGQSTP